jgi:hypothetical protein
MNIYIFSKWVSLALLAVLLAGCPEGDGAGGGGGGSAGEAQCKDRCFAHYQACLAQTDQDDGHCLGELASCQASCPIN